MCRSITVGFTVVPVVSGPTSVFADDDRPGHHRLTDARGSRRAELKVQMGSSQFSPASLWSVTQCPVPTAASAPVPMVVQV